VFRPVRVGKPIGTRVNQAHRVVQLVIGQQPGSGRDLQLRNWSISWQSKSSLNVLSPVGSAIIAPFDFPTR
jgi:hypothetical protein